MGSIWEDQNGEPRYQEIEDPETGDYVVSRVGHLPKLARKCLTRLGKVGLHTKWRSKEDNIQLVRLKESGQAFWLEFGRYRDHWAVPSVEGMAETQRQDIAILAALTVSEAELTDIEHLSNEVLPKVKELLESGECSSIGEAFAMMRMPWPGKESKEGNKLRDSWQPLLSSKVNSQALYVTLLLEHFRPDLNSYPPDEQIALFEQTCKQVNAFLRAARQLANFLEYGAPKSTEPTAKSTRGESNTRPGRRGNRSPCPCPTLGYLSSG
jgi:hypothetical protein